LPLPQSLPSAAATKNKLKLVLSSLSVSNPGKKKKRHYLLDKIEDPLDLVKTLGKISIFSSRHSAQENKKRNSRERMKRDPKFKKVSETVEKFFLLILLFESRGKIFLGERA